MPGANPARVTLPILDATTLAAACRQMLADARAAFDALAALPLDAATPASVLDEWDRIAIVLENIEGPIAILNNAGGGTLSGGGVSPEGRYGQKAGRRSRRRLRHRGLGGR